VRRPDAGWIQPRELRPLPATPQGGRGQGACAACPRCPAPHATAERRPCSRHLRRTLARCGRAGRVAAPSRPDARPTPSAAGQHQHDFRTSRPPAQSPCTAIRLNILGQDTRAGLPGRFGAILARHHRVGWVPPPPGRVRVGIPVNDHLQIPWINRSSAGEMMPLRRERPPGASGRSLTPMAVHCHPGDLAGHAGAIRGTSSRKGGLA
jgi:hypothetical protein